VSDEVARTDPIEVRALLAMIQTRTETVTHLLDIAQRYPSSQRLVGDARHTAERLVRLFTEIEVLGVAVHQAREARRTGDLHRARYA
jgi:hypothetical protein